ncbi:heat-inducible transcriptional repressor HrcA [Pseudogracilibacillus auburnensis]|uniref:Heat-inducible transcription repressor HrcA n=1 Tax=Pseudogracilibacillus auburnensis TaxID=1494959 RepID=A0A2V3VWZ8_9BACI|nr:heat-inducible transcriptional repressor HrcA [Pseudogracilibacillus auburnensis]MBO1003469.1 heat-inducible transcriptional repressor HrcA [Pseudogracilibacillus auburnensis]PXW86543.1 heat-inducible transcription repressor HrcA [Pseudogracilibacillus auburnensis]
MLTDRQLLILQTIIDDFIATAYPIGSRALSKNKSINLSAATIRNVMADLEEMELLEKTHSSSGRIPSEKGYRYYVDHVISPTFKGKEINIIKHIIQDNMVELEQVVQLSAEVLSQLTNYTAIILGPNEVDATLKQIQIITLTSQTAVAILVTSTGHVEHKSFSIPKGMDIRELEKMVNILNDRLIGVPIMQLPYTLQTEVYELMKKHIKDFELMYEYIQSVIRYDEQAKLYVGGQSNILMQPEFKDVDKIYEFYSMLENEAEIIKLLASHEDGIQVTIGNENKMEAIKNFSLITSSYKLGGNQLGTIALLGPTRMEYRKVITILQALSNEMTDILYVTYKQMK